MIENDKSLYGFSFYGSIFLIGLTIFFWQLFGVPIHDDFCYMRVPEPTSSEDFWNAHGRLIHDAGDMLEAMHNHYLYVNGRLTNLIMIATVLLPRWIPSLFLGISASFFLWLIFICVRRQTGSNVSLVLVWLTFLLVWIWFPWYNNMSSRDYLINYLVPSLFIMGYYLFYTLDVKRKNIKPSLLFGGSIFAFILGWLHEGFALPAIGASVIYILYQKKLNYYRLILLIALIAGSVINIFSPSTISRLLSQNEGPRFEFGYACLYNFLFSLWIPLVLTFILSVFLCLKKAKEIKDFIFNEFFIFWIIVFIVGSLIALPFNGTGRFYWLPSLSLLLISLSVANRYFRLPPLTRSILASLFFIVSITFSVMLIVWTKKVGDTQRKLLSQLSHNSNGIAYVDLIQRENIPWYTFGLVSPYRTAMCELGSYTNGYRFDRAPLILPLNYKNKPFDQWNTVNGDNPFKYVQGYIYSKTKLPENIKFKATFEGKTKNALPLKTYSNLYEGVTGIPIPVLTENNDTLWIYDLDLPVSMYLKNIDLSQK